MIQRLILLAHRLHASAEKAEKATAGRGDTYIHSRMLTHADALVDTYIHDVGSEARRRHHALALTASAYVSLCQHTSACVSIRRHASAYVSIRQNTSTRRHPALALCPYVCPHTAIYASQTLLYVWSYRSQQQHLSRSAGRLPTLRQHTSACVSIRLLRQYTSACRLQDTPRLRLLYYYITYYMTLTDHCVSVGSKIN